MVKKKAVLKITDEAVISKIYIFRGQRVMLDKDLAELYGVETKVFNQAVKRNIRRFPVDFMFDLTEKEFKSLRSQIALITHVLFEHYKLLKIRYLRHRSP